MTTSARAWLTQEADDLLDEGAVGLYEFIWLLNGSAYSLSPDEAIQLSREVVSQILQDGKAQLFAVRWPSFAIVSGPLADSVLDDRSSWSEGDAGPLLALVPAHDPDAA